MNDLIERIRNICSYYLNKSSFNPKKRRSTNDDEDFLRAKRRILNGDMNTINYLDDPSSSKPSYTKFPTRRRPLGDHINGEIIDLSDDDDDLIEISSSRKSVSLQRRAASPPPKETFPARRMVTPRRIVSPRREPSTSAYAMNGCNTKFETRSRASVILERAQKHLEKSKLLLKSPSMINDVNRLQERDSYLNRLQQSPSTATVYRQDFTSSPILNDTQKLIDIRSFKSTQKDLRKSFEKKSPAPLIDLTDEKSSRSGKDSLESDIEIVSVKYNIEPLNIYKRRFNIEPGMSPKFLATFGEQQRQRDALRKRSIDVEKERVQKLSNVNQENTYKLLTEQVSRCKLTDVIIPVDDYETQEIVPPLSEDQEVRVDKALNCRNPGQIFVEKFSLRITGTDLKTLNDKEWLNDEVINFYVNLIQERSERPGLPNVYSFSTFFYPKLISSGYTSLRRWTRRVDIFSYDLLVVPIHLGFHWCMAIVDFRDKSIRYYDSMRGNNLKCLSALENYLKEESIDKKKCKFDTADWRKEIMKDIPKQMNGSDCGVFSCTFAEFLSRNARISFTQEHMPNIRRKMVIEIIEGRLLT